MNHEIQDATLIPKIFVLNYKDMGKFRTWCHKRKLGELELLLPVWEEEELFEHCAVILSVTKAKRKASKRKFHETTLKA